MATDLILAAAQEMHACFCAQLNITVPVDDRPQRCCLFVGEDFEMGVAINEDMCKCGTAWVRVAGITPTGIFPNQMSEATNCAPTGWSLSLELGVARCPPLGDAYNLPSCDDWAAYTARVMTDAQAMRQAIICCLSAARPNRQYLIGGWAPFGPQGLCGGGKMTVDLQLLRCNEC